MAVDPYLFGGSVKQVRRTQQRFVRHFLGEQHARHQVPPFAPILDIGCGRGIFLALLREEGLNAVGIDTHAPAVEQCTRGGLEAFTADAVEFLTNRSGEFSGIFCSHVIEHLSFETAQTLLTRCSDALIEDGSLAVVTPNSRDIGVIGETFWLDTTHVRPYPLRLLASMVQDAGLVIVEQGTFHGGLPKREWPRALLYKLFLGPFIGRPNAFVIARKPLNSNS
jgi:2-polyprenyl-3-methyl-5-hydroxy-6-metoxy-1,4-benzoquinol methylase